MLFATAALLPFALRDSHAQAAPATQTAAQRAVLVTGASSGLGRKITERLAASGYFVYAGARKPEDIAALGAIRNVQGIRLDVTIPAEIAAAVETVKKGGRGLYGVVNNAGVAIIAPLIEVEERDLDFLFDVNVYGPYRVTKAFAPLLLESRGRVVHISSISGILSGAMLGPYSMSKHAIEAYGDALSVELARFGVRVSLIEPGNYRSDIGLNVLARAGNIDSAVKGSRYEAQMRSAFNSMHSYETGVEPDSVAAAALHAISSATPRMRYMVVPAAGQALATIRKAIDELVQLNEGHQFTYDREALIRMLDSAIVRVRMPR
jgi:NAD(P)-dependent dehydrogenase (short-subunit alcohol dehydrogenase family)